MVIFPCNFPNTAEKRICDYIVEVIYLSSFQTAHETVFDFGSKKLVANTAAETSSTACKKPPCHLLTGFSEVCY